MEETIETLRAERLDLVNAIMELDSDASKVEIHEMYGEISEIDRKIHAIDPTKI